MTTYGLSRVNVDWQACVIVLRQKKHDPCSVAYFNRLRTSHIDAERLSHGKAPNTRSQCVLAHETIPTRCGLLIRLPKAHSSETLLSNRLFSRACYLFTRRMPAFYWRVTVVHAARSKFTRRISRVDKALAHYLRRAVDQCKFSSCGAEH